MYYLTNQRLVSITSQPECTVELEILPGENFTICSHCEHIFFYCVNDYIGDRVTFTALMKINSVKYFYSTMGLMNFFP